ncbi:MAG: Fe-S cluster assembly protein HesB [Actinobacteria bacterium]|nr:Fe-S cluster assembly protein HesB [Actinomycetota bacterium]
MTLTIEIPLVGGGREPVDLKRTLMSHGVGDLPPSFIDEDRPTLVTTIELAPGRARTVTIEQGSARTVRVSVAGRRPSKTDAAALETAVAHILRLDQDLSLFYEMVKADPELSWAGRGAGRMTRSATVLEDLVKTVCTTNCTWSATVRMVTALVEHLGTPAPGAPPDGPQGRAFPSAEVMAGADESFYREVVRAGYRGPYLAALARSVATGELDLEALGSATPDELPDDELEATLLALPGVGPYAAAHMMMMLGRYSRLILDSWTRPTFLARSGMKRAKDSTITRRFKPYGDYSGLAFWLYLTESWVED